MTIFALLRLFILALNKTVPSKSYLLLMETKFEIKINCHTSLIINRKIMPTKCRQFPVQSTRYFNHPLTIFAFLCLFILKIIKTRYCSSYLRIIRNLKHNNFILFYHTGTGTTGRFRGISGIFASRKTI